MPFEDYSSIEDFRIQYHGSARLRLLKRSAGTVKTYDLLAELTRGFFIGRDRPTSEAKLQDILTIDLRYSPMVDSALILDHLIAVDLVREDDSFLRYTIGANTRPVFSEFIFSQVLNASFNDRNAIVGVWVPDDDIPGGSASPIISRYVHNQTIAANTWIVNHNLGERPIVQILDSGNNVIEGEIVHQSVNQVRIYLTASITGSVRCI